MRKRRSTKLNDKKLTIAAQALLYFFTFVDYMPMPFESKTHYVKRFFKGSRNYYTYFRVMKKLEEKGWLKIFKDPKSKKDLFCLTDKGRLEALFVKAQLPQKEEWDGKWRMVIFDIPEDARFERDKLRELLKINGFKTVQKSVYINPYALNNEAISYLQQTGLDKYIRIFRVDKADNDKLLRKMFGL